MHKITSRHPEQSRGIFSTAVRRSLHALRLVGMTTFFLLLIPNSAYAHILQIDGSIGAEMHLNPEDDPIVGEKSSFFFEFKDKTNRFNPKACDCTFTVVLYGKELYKQLLFQNSVPSLTNASATYTFPKQGNYSVIVAGKPRSAENFESFILTYPVNVQRISKKEDKKIEHSSNWFSEHIPQIAGGVLSAVALVFLISKGRGRKEK